MSLIFKPSLFPEDKRNNKDMEYKVYDALKQLPQEADGLTVIYNPDFNYGNAEADFLLLHPDFGCLILEVKNWNFDNLDKKEGVITTNGHKVDPREQLRHYREQFGAYILKNKLTLSNIKVPINIALLLINPSCNQFDNPTDFFGVTTIKEEVTHYNGEFWKALKSCASHPFRRTEEIQILHDIASSFYRTEKPELVDPIKKVVYMPTNDVLDARAYATLSPMEQYQESKKRLSYAVDELGKMLPKSKDFAERCESLAERVTSDELRIGLFGLTGAGKSTFINALLGVECMKSGQGETTRVVTELRCSDEQHPHGTVELEYKTLEEINHEVIVDVNEDLSYEIDDSFSVADETVREKLDEWVDDVEDPDNSMFVESVLNGWNKYHECLGTQQMDAIGSEADKMLHSSKGEQLAVFIRKRKLYFDAPFLCKDMVLLDTPGFGSGVKRHTKLALEMAQDLDVILLLDKVNAPVMGEEKECLRQLFENNKTQQMNAGGAQFICILNQISHIPPSEDYEEQIDRFRQKLKDAGIRDAQIFGIDSLQAFWSKRKKNALKLTADEEQIYIKICSNGSCEKYYAQSHFKDIEDKLPRYLMDNKYKVGIKRKVLEFLSLAETMEDYFAAKKADLASTNRDAEEKLSILEQQIKRSEKEILVFKAENLPEIIQNTVEKFTSEHNIAKEIQQLYHQKLITLGKLPFGDEKRKKLVDEIRPVLESKLKQLQEDLKRTYITMRDTVLKKRIEECIRGAWPEFNMGFLGTTLSILPIDEKDLMEKILPGFWKALLHFFNSQTYFEQFFAEKIEPELERNFYRNIGLWAQNFIADVEERFAAVAHDQKEGRKQAIKLVDLTKEEKDKAASQLRSCQDKLTELRTKLKPVIRHLEGVEPNTCNVATLDLSLNDDCLVRKLFVGNRRIVLPKVEMASLGDILGSYENKWKDVSAIAQQSFVDSYVKELEELFAWADVDQKLEQMSCPIDILQLNLSSALAGIPYELMANSSDRTYSILRRIDITEPVTKPCTNSRSFLLIASEDDVNPPDLLENEIHALQTLCDQQGVTFQRFACYGKNWENKLVEAMSQASIVHFAGHGCQTQDGTVFILNQNCYVNPAIFRRLTSCPRMLWLNNCYGGDAASNGFVETAASIGIPIVIGSSVKLRDIEAWSLPEKIYESLFAGKTMGSVVKDLSSIKEPAAEVSIYADASANIK